MSHRPGLLLAAAPLLAAPLLAAVLGAAFAPAPALAQAKAAAPPPLQLQVKQAPHANDGTRCAVCHTAESWKRVSFDHAKTGFILRGAHARAACSGCHGADLSQPVPRNCTACHRDFHAGEFGSRCQGCHEETSWKPLFDVDAHRRTNFPLVGRHALIPCEECHIERRDRSFTRATVECVACHQRDFTRAAGTALDHQRAGFATTCRDCHAPWRWAGAHFPAHEVCFAIAKGPHGGIDCLACHTATPNVSGLTGSCSTNNAACTRCHTCSSTDGRHAQVGGYQCKDRKCWECHKFSTASLPRKL